MIIKAEWKESSQYDYHLRANGNTIASVWLSSNGLWSTEVIDIDYPTRDAAMAAVEQALGAEQEAT